MSKLICLLFILSLLGIVSQAYAHAVQQDDAYLQAASGDNEDAEQLSKFCTGAFKASRECLDDVIGMDPLKKISAIKCAGQITEPLVYRFAQKKDEPEGARGHSLGGKVYHTNYMTTPEEGRHRYDYSPEMREKARRQYEISLIEDRNRRWSGVEGNRSQTTGSENTGSINGEGSTGKLLPGLNIGGNVEHSTSNSSTRSAPPFSKDEIIRVERESQAAYENPALAGVEPDLYYGPGTLPDPKVKSANAQENTLKKKDPEKNDTKKEDHKPQPEAAKSEQPKIKERTSASEEHHNSWAGEPSPSRPGESWATPVVDPLLGEKSTMEKCMDDEYRKLLFKIGSETRDPAALSDVEKAADAEYKLKLGECDKDHYGRDFCQTFKNKKDSTPDWESSLEREFELKNAKERFKLSGECDPRILGESLCAERRRTLDSTYFKDNFSPDESRVEKLLKQFSNP